MPKIYYKATQPDGTDFYTGTVNYAGALESGRPLKRKPVPASGRFETCSDTVYHAADTPSETLVAASWPCRLFEVTGRPVASEGHKFGFRSLQVVREIEPWNALGPNGQEVAALIGEVGSWTPAARVAARNAARNAAWNAARGTTWNAARAAAWAAAWNAAWDAAWDAAWAAGALVVRDLIAPEHFDVLFAPVAAAREAMA